MHYWIRLITRCGCTKELSLGTSSPSVERPEWLVPLLRRKVRIPKPGELPETRVFEYTGVGREGPYKTVIYYHEKEPG